MTNFDSMLNKGARCQEIRLIELWEAWPPHLLLLRRSAIAGNFIKRHARLSLRLLLCVPHIICPWASSSFGYGFHTSFMTPRLTFLLVMKPARADKEHNPPIVDYTF